MKTLDVLVTASGSSQLTVSELFNDVGTCAWSRVGTGLYKCECPDAFPSQFTTTNYSVLTKIVDGGDNEVGIIFSPEGGGANYP